MDIKLFFTDTFSEPKSIFTKQLHHFNGEFLQKGLYEQHFRDTSLKIWYVKLSLKREEIILINRIRSNHYNLNWSVRGHVRAGISSKILIFHCPITIPKPVKFILFIDPSFKPS